MPGLGETMLELMRRRQQAAGGSQAGRGAQAGQGAQVGRGAVLAETRMTGSNPGGLRMRSLVPPGLPPGAPLVVALHGCTQTAEGYDGGAGWSTLAARHGFALLLPEQDRANNGNLCFNWFEPGDIARGQGEALSIKQMVDQAISTHGLNPARVGITGLSAGGAMAAAMLATYPEVFAAGAVVAGLPYGVAAGMSAALQAMRGGRGSDRTGPEWGERVRAACPRPPRWPTVQIWHGSADTVVSPANAEALERQWCDVHGVLAAPASSTVDGVAVRRWRDGAGAVVVESYRVPGMGHGTPITPGAGDLDQSVGQAGPYALPGPISSTWRIAQSWGLLTQAARPRTHPRAAAPGFIRA